MYVCDCCEFKTVKENNYKRHLSTTKHIRASSFISGNEQNNLQTTVDVRLILSPDDQQSRCEEVHEDDELQDDRSEDQREREPFIGNSNQGEGEQTEYYPFKNKLHLLLYILKNSPTHAVSNEVVKFVMFIMKEVGIKEEIPSMHELDATSFGDLNWETLVDEHHAEDGTSFWCLKPSEILKLFLANPKFAGDIMRYPTSKNNHPSGAEKWQKDLAFHHMRVENVSFFTGKMYTYKDDQTEEEQHGMLKSFIDDVNHDAIKAVIQPYTETNEDGSGHQRVVRALDYTIHVPLKQLKECNEQAYCQLESVSNLAAEKPSIPVWTLPVNIFVDDTSAIRSKRWLGLHCVQMQPAGLKLHLRQHHESIFLLGASEKVDPNTLMKPVISDIQNCKRNGISGFDAYRMEECTITTDLNVVVADFNMQSYLCNHLGATATKYCPRCYADAEHAIRKAEERTPTKTLTTINRINMRSMETDKRKLRQRTGVKEYENHIWDVLNPHRDIPVGFLHLIPLGLTKHLVKNILKSISDEKVERLQAHLSSLTNESFANNFFSSINSRQGKDFKQYLQFAPINFAFVGIPREHLKMLTTLAEIQKILLKDEFVEEDIVETEHLVNKYLQLVDEHAPELKRKVKTHLLCHLVDDIRRHGPPKGYTEDGFEKKHASIRNDIFHQNQKQRSRDTAISFSHMTLLNHVISGGYFPVNDDWVCIGEKARTLGQQREIVQFIGREMPQEEGEVPIKKLKRKPNGKVISTAMEECILLQLCTEMEVPAFSPEDAVIFTGKAARTRRKNELANSGDAVQYLSSQNEVAVGIFEEGLIIKRKRSAEVINAVKLQIMEKTGIATETGCKIFELKDTFIFVSPSKLVQLEHIFHNCKYASCRVTKTNSNEMGIVRHRNVNSYIWNQFKL